MLVLDNFYWNFQGNSLNRSVYLSQIHSQVIFLSCETESGQRPAHPLLLFICDESTAPFIGYSCFCIHKPRKSTNLDGPKEFGVNKLLHTHKPSFFPPEGSANSSHHYNNVTANTALYICNFATAHNLEQYGMLKVPVMTNFDRLCPASYGEVHSVLWHLNIIIQCS